MVVYGAGTAGRPVGRLGTSEQVIRAVAKDAGGRAGLPG